MTTFKFKEGVSKLVVPGIGTFKEADINQKVYDRLKSVDERLVQSIIIEETNGQESESEVED